MLSYVCTIILLVHMLMYKSLQRKERCISVIGLGYVGLPLALELGRHFRVIAFDINPERVVLMQRGIDPSKELDKVSFDNSDIEFTSDPNALQRAHFHIIAVPTDIDEYQLPDLDKLLLATDYVGQALKDGDYVVYESSVYPGCTEEKCIPILEKISGLTVNRDFKIAYSPERIVPGDKMKNITSLVKVVSAGDAESREEVAQVYATIVSAGIYRASSIQVAEAAKVVENIQRDINISLMNELAIIFDKMGIDTNEVIDAASTKWNFHKYSPGLVGGHCIGVDPYYLIHRAKQMGVDPQVIAAGRRVNDYIPQFIAKRLIQYLIEKSLQPNKCRVLVMGITFKENVSDIRNSKVVNLIKELMDYSLTVEIMDPRADPQDVMETYGLTLIREINKTYDAIVIAVGHDEFKEMTISQLQKWSHGDLILMDVKGIRFNLSGQIVNYWRL
jgi:UDP-N-acetyl-D-glucosamine/UDP-N-acetyl-D-galactosamine dehydrogenase